MVIGTDCCQALDYQILVHQLLMTVLQNGGGMDKSKVLRVQFTDQSRCLVDLEPAEQLCV